MIFSSKKQFKYLKQLNVVPLGEHCMLAHHVKKADLNKHNYGFEWIITPSLSTLTKWLVQSNTSFFDPQNIRYQSEDSSMKDIMFEISSIHEYKKKACVLRKILKLQTCFPDA